MLYNLLFPFKDNLNILKVKIEPQCNHYNSSSTVADLGGGGGGGGAIFQIFGSKKKKIGPPPLRNPGSAPVLVLLKMFFADGRNIRFLNF